MVTWMCDLLRGPSKELAERLEIGIGTTGTGNRLQWYGHVLQK